MFGRARNGLERRTMSRRREKFLAAVLLAIGMAFNSIHANIPPAFIAGDLIVKFTKESPFGVLLAQELRSDRVNAKALNIAAESLSAELGVALVPIRVTSGQELVLSIERSKLARALQQQVARDPAVHTVSLVASANALLPATEINFTVDFAEHSASKQAVLQAAQARLQTSSEIRRLVARLVSGIYPQPAGRIDSHGQFILTVDVAALTRDLVTRLKRRPDVVYVQPSQIVRPNRSKPNTE